MHVCRSFRKLSFGIVVGMMSIGGGATLADDQADIERAEAGILAIVQMAKDGRFAELEAKAAERRAYADANPDKDVSFDEIFDPFRRADPDLAGPLKDWRAKYPKSFAPYMALGAYNTTLGWVVRGEGAAYRTNRKRFEEMRRYFDEAVSAIRMGIRLYPKVPKAWTRLIGMASATGDTVEVDSLFGEAVGHVPNSSYLYRTYYNVLAPKWGRTGAEQIGIRNLIKRQFFNNPDFGWIDTVADNDAAWDRYWHDDLAAALALFDKIIAARPDFDSRYGRAATLLGMNRVDDAIAEYHRVLALDPGNSKIYSALATAQGRRAEMKEEAARSLDRALLFNPYNPEYLYRRARMYLDRSQPEIAKRYLDKALLLGAYDDDVHDQLRRYYWKIGDMQTAIVEAEKMVTLMPMRPRNWFLFALTLEHSKDCRALDAYERYQQLCVMNRDCGDDQRKMAALYIYQMKQACG